MDWSHRTGQAVGEHSQPLGVLISDQDMCATVGEQLHARGAHTTSGSAHHDRDLPIEPREAVVGARRLRRRASHKGITLPPLTRITCPVT